MLNYNEKQTISKTDSSWSSGSISKNTKSVMGELKQVMVKATTSTNNFKFKIEDKDGLPVYDTEDYETGTLNQFNLSIPLYGIYTMTIYAADTEELFEIRLGIRE